MKPLTFEPCSQTGASWNASQTGVKEKPGKLEEATSSACSSAFLPPYTVYVQQAAASKLFM